MSQEFDAIYERGLFRPLQRVDLPEHAKVHLHIQDVSGDESASLVDDASAKTAVRELLDWVESQPSVPIDKSCSARDHDRILYGWQK